MPCIITKMLRCGYRFSLPSLARWNIPWWLAGWRLRCLILGPVRVFPGRVQIPVRVIRFRNCFESRGDCCIGEASLEPAAICALRISPGILERCPSCWLKGWIIIKTLGNSSGCIETMWSLCGEELLNFDCFCLCQVQHTQRYWTKYAFHFSTTFNYIILVL